MMTKNITKEIDLSLTLWTKNGSIYSPKFAERPHLVGNFVLKKNDEWLCFECIDVTKSLDVKKPYSKLENISLDVNHIIFRIYYSTISNV